MVEAIVVPAIGRVMQFRLAGERDCAFWENGALDGRSQALPSGEWANFGGDKCWPAPQSDWQQLQGRPWPPPAAFDATPMQAVAGEGSVVLTSVLDPDWGIQVVRTIALEPGQPVLRIQTEFHKLKGPAVRVAIWTIAQMPDPECIGMLLHPGSRFAEGYTRLLELEPAGLRLHNLPNGDRFLALTRHSSAETKIGADGASLAWVGPTCAVRIDVEATAGEYPDGGCMTEVYTNPDPLRYVELETLGPLTEMRAGDRICHAAVYTLSPRTTADATTEAIRLFCSGSA